MIGSHKNIIGSSSYNCFVIEQALILIEQATTSVKNLVI